MKKYSFHILFLLFLASVFAFSLHGLPGNPKAEDLASSSAWREDGPFELSPERGRFAIVYSLIEDHSLLFSLPVARFVAPDLALSPDHHFVSLFAPFVSFIVVPGYVLGRFFDGAQVGTFAIIAFFAIANGVLIGMIARQLGASRIASALGSIAFLFGTPAFAYGSTLYQHHISVFLLLLSLWIMMRFQGFWSLSCVWFLVAFSVVVDNPNFFLFMPVGILALLRVIHVKKGAGDTAIVIHWKHVLTTFFLAIPMAGLLWYNASVNGSPWKLSGTLPSVVAIATDGTPLDHDPNQPVVDPDDTAESNRSKSAVAFFKTRNLVMGLSTHLFDPDRGTLWYAPVAFFGILGIVLLYRRRENITWANVLLGTVLATLLLYSMWGDPWGGWAFGSRYMIPAYAVLGIGVAVALTAWRRNWIILFVFAILLFYSISVNTLGALTSDANPPQHEVLALEKFSGKVQKYTYERNWDYLHESGSKSFFFRTVAHSWMSAVTYYFFVVALILLVSAGMLIGLFREKELRNRKNRGV